MRTPVLAVGLALCLGLLVSSFPRAARAADDPEDVRLKALESEVDVLKEKIFKSKARLLLLQETVLHGATAGAVAKIRFKNDMGGAYKLESATWVLDGQTIVDEKDPAALAGTANAARLLFDGAIVPGSHNLSVTLVYRGSGYEVFSYLEGYRFTVQSAYAFLAEEGKATDLEAVAYPKDGFKNKYEDRLDVRFQVSSQESSQESAQESAQETAPVESTTP